MDFKIHGDPRVWSLTDLENVCVLYGNIGRVIVGLELCDSTTIIIMI